jgi:hypothetical protein
MDCPANGATRRAAAANCGGPPLRKIRSVVQPKNATLIRHMTWTIPWNLIGLMVSGDFADLTIYTDRHQRKIPFPRSPPKEPPSQAQIEQRLAFKRAVNNYKNISPAETAQWENVTRRLSIPQTGQNLFVSLSFSQDNLALQTLNSQASMSLTLPPAVR